jgi:hypothetical protein
VILGTNLAWPALGALITTADKLTDASFLILIAVEPSDGMAVICAPNEQAHASTDDTATTVFIQILLAGAS